MARTAPTTPVTTASMRNGTCVYQRVAPTRRMIPTSVRRVNAESWMVLEISSSAAITCTSASPNAALRMPARKENRSSTRRRWSTTLRTPGFPVNRSAMTAPSRGSSIVTRRVAGSDCGRTSCRIDWPA